MEFEALEALQRRLRDLKRLQSVSLGQYFAGPSRAGVGFRHLWHETNKPFSRASTATCVVSLTSSRAWWREKDSDGVSWTTYRLSMLRQFCRQPPHKWKSAGLKEGNPFTVAFLLEGIKALVSDEDNLNEPLPADLDTKVNQTIRDAETLLLEALNKNGQYSGRIADRSPDQFAETGAANVAFYPPTAFLTQLVVRALDVERLMKRPTLAKKVQSWCRRQIEHELTLLNSNASTRDPLALAYAVAAFVAFLDPDSVSRTDANLVATAVDQVFTAQLEDGSWPRSRPLHHYPQIGDAYCYEYETLVQLLQQKYLQQILISKLDHLDRSVRALDKTANNLPAGGKAWASGHHPHLLGAESWSTASVYHFVHCLDRIVAEAQRKKAFDHVGALYTPPNEPAKEPVFAQKFLDSRLQLDGRSQSLRKTVLKYFLGPIFQELSQVKHGEPMSQDTKTSAILFGPPGTAKTTLADLIAKFLGWPRLDIDPSHLFKGGLEQIQSESNRLFSILASLERVVVFFDEFDEMVRERTSERADLVSRFLTTAMLPKLKRIADERKVVFLLATNHIEDFDFAISRPGRFDFVLPVMPPTLSEKFKLPQWKAMKEKFGAILSTEVDKESKRTVKQVLEDLTFDEFRALHKSCQDQPSSHLLEEVRRVWKKATLNKKRQIPEEGRTEPLFAFYSRQVADITRVPK